MRSVTSLFIFHISIVAKILAFMSEYKGAINRFSPSPQPSPSRERELDRYFDTLIILNMASAKIYVTINTRKDDLTDWKYVCKIDGDRIIWAANPGRWRNHPNDPRLSFAIDGKSIAVKIRYSETSSVEKTYTLDEL